MISLIYHLNNLRFAVPAVLMLGNAPTFLAVWTPFRFVTSVLPRSFFVKGDDFLYSLYQRLILFFFEHYTGIEVVLYGDADEVLSKKENVIYMSNHQSAVDWLVAEMLAVRQGLIGHVRYVLKDGLRYLPMYGYYFRQHSCVYVGRSKSFNEQRARQHLELLRDMPFWLVIFPEGTRFTPERVDARERSRQYALDNDLPMLDEVYTPRSKAAWLCASVLKQQAQALYDVTVAYSNTATNEGQRTAAPGLPEFLMRASPRVHIHVKRYAMEDVPANNEDEFKLWLAQRFHEKDELMKQFYKSSVGGHGSFGPDGRISPLALRETFPAFILWMAASAPLVLTPSGRYWYYRFGVIGTVLGIVWMIVKK